MLLNLTPCDIDGTLTLVASQIVGFFSGTWHFDSDMPCTWIVTTAKRHFPVAEDYETVRRDLLHALGG